MTGVYKWRKQVTLCEYWHSLLACDEWDMDVFWGRLIPEGAFEAAVLYICVSSASCHLWGHWPLEDAVVILISESWLFQIGLQRKRVKLKTASISVAWFLRQIKHEIVLCAGVISISALLMMLLPLRTVIRGCGMTTLASFMWRREQDTTFCLSVKRVSKLPRKFNQIE